MDPITIAAISSIAPAASQLLGTIIPQLAKKKPPEGQFDAVDTTIHTQSSMGTLWMALAVFIFVVLVMVLVWKIATKNK
jgi:hypothetical protein